MILSTIREKLPEMAPSARKIASYILDNEQGVAFASIHAVGEAAGVSVASLVRFAKGLGLDGYQDLKRRVQEEVRSQLSPYQTIVPKEFEDLPAEQQLQKLFLSEVDNLRLNFEQVRLDQIQAMAHSIRDARRIYISGFGASANIARSFEYTLMTSIDKEVSVITGSVSDYAPRLRSFGSGDLMFILTFPPYSKEVRHVAKVAKTQGGTLNLFTDSANCPIYPLADSVVRCNTNSLLMLNSYVGLFSTLNILVHMVLLVYREESVAARRRTYALQDDGYDTISGAPGGS